jgi:hypothetical protein
MYFSWLNYNIYIYIYISQHFFPWAPSIISFLREESLYISQTYRKVEVAPNPAEQRYSGQKTGKQIVKKLIDLIFLWNMVTPLGVPYCPPLNYVTVHIILANTLDYLPL